MKIAATILSSGALLLGSAAMAQETPPTPQAPDEKAPITEVGQDMAIPQDAPMPSAAQTPQFTDEQIERFVNAAMRMRDLTADQTMDAQTRQTLAQDIIAEEGLDVPTYSAIAAAAQTDPATARRVQLAIAARQEPGVDS